MVHTIQDALKEREEKRRIAFTVETDEHGIIRFMSPYGVEVYSIGPEQIDTPEKCIFWLLTLSRKQWADSDVLYLTARSAAEHHGYRIPQGPYR